MITLAVAQWRKTFYGKDANGVSVPYELQATTRMVDADINLQDIYADLTVRTVKLWFYLASCIQKGERQLPEAIAYKTVEQSVIDEVTLDETMRGFEFVDSPESRVTVFDWNHILHLTIHSNTLPQVALSAFWASRDALAELQELYPQQSSENAQKPVAPPSQGTNTPPPQAPAVEGVITATRAPSPKTPQYTDGQQSAYIINKVVATADKDGAALFELRGPLGRDFPIHRIYVTDKAGNPKKDYTQIKPLLDGLNLSITKPFSEVNWRLILQAKHNQKDGKTMEYMNLVSLTPI